MLKFPEFLDPNWANPYSTIVTITFANFPKLFFIGVTIGMTQNKVKYFYFKPKFRFIMPDLNHDHYCGLTGFRGFLRGLN